MFGLPFVQTSPERGSFPLLGLERKKVVVLDDWRFNSRVLPLNLQLLWFEGKPVPVVQPQGGSDPSGHWTYTGTAPIFITTPLGKIEEMESEVKHAQADGRGSEWSMLLRRLRVYRYTTPIRKPARQIPACAHCLAQYLFEAEALMQQRVEESIMCDNPGLV